MTLLLFLLSSGAVASGGPCLDSWCAPDAQRIVLTDADHLRRLRALGAILTLAPSMPSAAPGGCQAERSRPIVETPRRTAGFLESVPHGRRLERVYSLLGADARGGQVRIGGYPANILLDGAVVLASDPGLVRGPRMRRQP